ncbi:PREDICTED: basic salivary proline-rich protein 3-like [Dipodomys ordii]|uniref:Basic salivary proline-rich protein 3-like n=1 Tax=Dipodomys ordii TaxID=10020 RepID=A0A1S3F8B7_DIPOR|nr:PREDICTED: basic salivary proline-rich protein 3-like [Dipodomys ordii]
MPKAIKQLQIHSYRDSPPGLHRKTFAPPRLPGTLRAAAPKRFSLPVRAPRPPTLPKRLAPRSPARLGIVRSPKSHTASSSSISSAAGDQGNPRRLRCLPPTHPPTPRPRSGLRGGRPSFPPHSRRGHCLPPPATKAAAAARRRAVGGVPVGSGPPLWSQGSGRCLAPRHVQPRPSAAPRTAIGPPTLRPRSAHACPLARAPTHHGRAGDSGGARVPRPRARTSHPANFATPAGPHNFGAWGPSGLEERGRAPARTLTFRRSQGPSPRGGRLLPKVPPRTGRSKESIEKPDHKGAKLQSPQRTPGGPGQPPYVTSTRLRRLGAAPFCFWPRLLGPAPDVIIPRGSVRVTWPRPRGGRPQCQCPHQPWPRPVVCKLSSEAPDVGRS